ncbi:hypothetical protein GCM10027298_13690 [Epidermidibacterium keratini]
MADRPSADRYGAAGGWKWVADVQKKAQKRAWKTQGVLNMFRIRRTPQTRRVRCIGGALTMTNGGPSPRHNSALCQKPQEYRTSMPNRGIREQALRYDGRRVR